MNQSDHAYGDPASGDSGTPRSLARVLEDVAAERAAQDALWGVQDLPDGTGPEHAGTADAARRDGRDAWAAARLTWRHILTEEFYEALTEHSRSAASSAGRDQRTEVQDDECANSIAWLVSHLPRIQDDHLADAAGTAQVWTSRGWADRFGPPFDA